MFRIYWLISRVCPSRQHLSSHMLKACTQPVLLQRQTTEPRRRVPFSFTAPPSCKRLCWQHCDGCDPLGSWQTGSRPTRSVSHHTAFWEFHSDLPDGIFVTERHCKTCDSDSLLVSVWCTAACALQFVFPTKEGARHNTQGTTGGLVMMLHQNWALSPKNQLHTCT